MYKSALLFLLPAVLAENHVIQVGAGGEQVYSPTSLTAAVGDTLTFHWAGPYHSVSQSTFDEPCEYKDGGINSGVVTATGGQDFVVTVKDTNPLWIYCSVGKHCQNGMVMVVNPTSDQTYDAFHKSSATADSKSPPDNVVGGVFGTAASASSGASSSASSSASSMSSASSGAASAMSTMSSGSSAASVATTTSGATSATNAAQSSSASASPTKGAAVQYAGDVVAAVGAAALAVLL